MFALNLLLTHSLAVNYTGNIPLYGLAMSVVFRNISAIVPMANCPQVASASYVLAGMPPGAVFACPYQVILSAAHNATNTTTDDWVTYGKVTASRVKGSLLDTNLVIVDHVSSGVP
jgi:hypothetical protein